MHVQTQYPIPEFEMYIKDNASGKSEENGSYVLLSSNGSFGIEGGYYPDPEMVRQGSQQTARGVCLVIFIAIGTALNVFMVVSVVPNRRLRTVRNILLVHLGCTGLLTSYLVNLFTAVVSFTGQWFGGVILCQIFGYTMSVVTLVTTWTIAALSWDKYQTIASPLHHSFTATAVKMFVCFSVFWSVACSLSLPPLLGGSQYVFLPDKGICFVCTKTLTGKVYIVFYMLAAIYIPLGIMLYCYMHIYKIARTQSSRIAATMIRMTCVIQATVAPSSQTGSSMSVKGTKAMCTIFQLIGAFVLVYVPISVIFLTDIITSNEFKINGVLSSTFAMLFHSAPVINSSVYGLRNKILRASFQRYLRRKIRYYCYKDKRKNSVKSMRSASFKAAMLHRRNQNGSEPSLRRTQSFPVRGARGGRTPRVPRAPRPVEQQNGGHKIDYLAIGGRESLRRPHSFNVLNTQLPEQENGVAPSQEISDTQDQDNSQTAEPEVSETPELLNSQTEENVIQKPVFLMIEYDDNLPDDIPDIDAEDV